MQLRQMRHFLAALDTGSMTQAARDQNVTQPTLSRSIRMLELTLKVDLLERSHGGVVPTRYGEAFAEHARSIIAGTRQAKDDVSAMKAGRLGHVRLGLGESALLAPVARSIGRLSLLREDLRVSLDYDVQDSQLAKLRRGELDAIIDLGRPDLDVHDLSYKPVAKLVMVVMVRPQHPYARKGKVSRQELACMPWAILDQPGADNYYRQMLGAEEVFRNIRVRCVAPTMLRMIALESDMLIMMTRIQDQQATDDVLVELETDIPPVTTDLCLITRRRSYMTGALRFSLEEITRGLAQ